MATMWQEIICNSAMVFIDDEREKENMAISPARFFRRMSLYLNMAIPMLNRPPELLEYLKKDMIMPEYGDSEWISTDASVSGETVVDTGMTGFNVFSCVMRINDGGNVMELPYTKAEYDADTGNVTFPPQDAAGIVYTMDFYRDGAFGNVLSDRIIRLLGLAVACVWDDRFSNTWLNNAPKIHDDSFDVPNEANHMNATTRKRDANRMQFNGELKKYEQDVYYRQKIGVPKRNSMIPFL